MSGDGNYDGEDIGPVDGGEDIAAEYVLGLLTAGELLEARGRLTHHAGFARDVADWEARLAPLFDEIMPSVPPGRVWDAIAAALLAQPQTDQQNDKIVRLQRQVRVWRVGTGIAAVLAGVLAIVGLQPGAPVPLPPRVVAPPPPLAAALAPKGGGSISVVYHAGEHRLMALAGDLSPRAGHDLELWLLPPGGAPLSLGLVHAGQSRRLTPPASVSTKLVAGSMIAVSLEPVGGSPTDLPTGPVLAVAKILPA